MSKKIQLELGSKSCLDEEAAEAVKEEEVSKGGGEDAHHTPNSQMNRIPSSPVCPPAPRKKRRRKRSIEPQRPKQVIRSIKWSENLSQIKGDQYNGKNKEMR